MWVFGGHDSTNEIHCFDPKNCSWAQLELRDDQIPEDVPAKRYGHGSCIYDKKMFICGGCRGKTFFNDCYRFDLGNIRN